MARRSNLMSRQLLMLLALLLVATGLTVVDAPPAAANDCPNSTGMTTDYCSSPPPPTTGEGTEPGPAPPDPVVESGPVTARCSEWGRNAVYSPNERGWITSEVTQTDGTTYGSVGGKQYTVPEECTYFWEECGDEMGSDGLVEVDQVTAIPTAGKRYDGPWPGDQYGKKTSEECTYEYVTEVCPVAVLTWRFYGTPSNPTFAATMSKANNKGYATGDCGLNDAYSIPAYSPHDANVNPKNNTWGQPRSGKVAGWYEGLNFATPMYPIMGQYGASCTALTTTTMRDLLNDDVTRVAYGNMLADAYKDLYGQFLGYFGGQEAKAAAAAKSHLNLENDYVQGNQVVASDINNVPCDSSLEFMKRGTIDDDTGQISNPPPNTLGTCWLHLREGTVTRTHVITGEQTVTEQTGVFIDGVQSRGVTSRFQSQYAALARNAAASQGYSIPSGFASSLSCFDVDAAVAQEGCDNPDNCTVNVEDAAFPSTVYTRVTTPEAASAVGAYDPVTVRTHIDEPGTMSEQYCFHPDHEPVGQDRDNLDAHGHDPYDYHAPCDQLYPNSTYRPRISGSDPQLRVLFPGDGTIESYNGELASNDLAGKTHAGGHKNVGQWDRKRTLKFYEAGDREYVEGDYPGNPSTGSYVQVDPAGTVDMYSYATVEENVAFEMPLLLELSATKKHNFGDKVFISESADVGTQRKDWPGVPLRPWPNTDLDRQFPVLDGVIAPQGS